MGQALINLFHQKAPRVRFREGFGMTEGGPAITFTRGNLKDTMGSSGQLLPNMRSTFTLYLTSLNLYIIATLFTPNTGQSCL